MAKLLYPKKNSYCVNRRTVRDSLPFNELYEDGMMRCTAGKRNGEVNTWSMCYQIVDTNYECADSPEQRSLLQRWCEILNLFDSSTVMQITIANITPSRDILAASTQIPLKGDQYDHYREELNGMMERKLMHGGKRKIYKEKYLTISTVKKDRESAERYFARIKTGLRAGFARIGSGIAQLGEVERAKILHDIYRQKHEDEFAFRPKEIRKRGQTVKEAISPFRFKVLDDHMEIGEKFAQSLMLYEYPQFVEDIVLRKLTDIEKNMLLTITLVPIEKQDALDQCNRVYTNIESEIARYTRKQVANKNYNASIPMKTEAKRDSIIDLQNDLSNRDQGIFFMNMAITVFGETADEMLDAAETIIETGRQKQLRIIVNHYLQEDTFNTSMPYGLKFVENWRTMTSESVAAFNPFVARELMQPGGLYYGNHAITGSMIIGNRDLLDSSNAIITGATGKGKSMFSKAEMEQIFLRTDETTDIIIVDPEREFVELCELFNGEHIILSANSKNYINPMKLTDSDLLDIEDKPIALKAEFLQTVFEQLLGADEVGARQRSIIDRGLRMTYKEIKNEEPTLQDFYNHLKTMDEEEAAKLALGLEMFIEGSLNTFAQKSNIDVRNRFVVYDINELGAGLKNVGMSIMLDAIFEKVAKNRAAHRKTILYFDEFWVMMKHPKSAEYMSEMWRRFRKYGAWVTGITQNLQDLMCCEEGATIVKNASIAVILGQQPSDVKLLQQAYGLSDAQCIYIDDTPPGHGLLKFGDNFIPFDNEFDKSLSLYRAMTTNQLELRAYKEEQDAQEQ